MRLRAPRTAAKTGAPAAAGDAPAPASRTGPLLVLRDVAKHFQSGTETVQTIAGADLHLDAGEMIAIHGPSGSGKTTLLLLIAGLIALDRGSIHFDGRELSGLHDAQVSRYLHSEVGFICQRPQLMPRVPAIENAAMKLVLGGTGMRQARMRALPWLQRLGLGDRLRHTPEQLSAGECQRVAIARALAPEPRLVLADEPTACLDRARSEEVAWLMATAAREHGAAVVLVTHDLDVAAVADRGYALRDGRLIETHAERGRPAPTGSTPSRPAPSRPAPSGLAPSRPAPSGEATEALAEVGVGSR